MKLGFITATDPKNPFNKIEPSGLLYMASYLEKYLNFQDVIITEDLERLLEEKPDIVGISTYTTYLTRATEIADIIKEETSVPVIIGGPHVTLYPEYLPESCDIGVIGEGEETMLELLELYLKEKSFEPHELKKIHGIIFKEDSIRVKTQPRELIYPLDRIPPPKRELVENSFFVPSIMTSRGCPYRCAFCATSQVWKKFRMFSSEYVAREMVSLIDKDNFNKIEFGDDLFAVSTERVRDIHDIVIKNRFHEKTVFYVNVRANTFNEE
ncbi:MAG TPA: cobalamin-dependent protein, partial [Candidatus Eremiobacteraeota bacterium]|nr:cobalamin-dependent protein [Candidatus Eremiobacteraeota bacterium]